MYIHLQDRISEPDADLRRMINNHIWGPEFNKKEAEIRRLKTELARIDTEKTQPSLFTFQFLVFLLKGIQCTLTKSTVISYGMFQKPICVIQIVPDWMT